ncbi:MAG TPA: hypothetical protein GXX21_10725 [Syntrophomonadaceae bacterium]|nr:hypothetical protein [Syntrophomonadaceae bacterium]
MELKKNIFDSLSIGDKVKVEWGFRLHGSKECYGKEGVVEQITPSFIAIRTRAGYVFCVNYYHIRMGTAIKKKASRAA